MPYQKPLNQSPSANTKQLIWLRNRSKWRTAGQVPPKVLYSLHFGRTNAGHEETTHHGDLCQWGFSGSSYVATYYSPSQENFTMNGARAHAKCAPWTATLTAHSQWKRLDLHITCRWKPNFVMLVRCVCCLPSLRGSTLPNKAKAWHTR